MQTVSSQIADIGLSDLEYFSQTTWFLSKETGAKPLPIDSDACVLGKVVQQLSVLMFHLFLIFLQLKKKPACTTVSVPLNISVSGKNIFK